MIGTSFDEIKKEIRDAIQMDYIEPADIPAIELYMDQVTTFMDKHLSNNKRQPEDKILTKTMINNYTKNHLLPPPEKKKYSKEHIILLIYTYYLKNFLSIGDIQKLLNPMIENYFTASEKDSVNLTSIYSTVVELAQHQYQLDKQGIFESYELVYKKLKEEHPETPMDENMSYLQDFTFVALLSYDIYLKTQLVEKIIDQLAPLPEAPAQKESAEPKKKEK
ncbi:MAG: DUF1836 domain-containing protein [Bacteroides sp.]|nr:DUF1836 domain-containing protein [Bacteroides sp.]MCM1550579.1 DUF1836 domain-containing protein [Clostridium sp.]